MPIDPSRQMSRLFSTITSKNGERRRQRSESPPGIPAPAEPPPTTPKLDLITQSPTTARIVKKGRPDEPQGEVTPTSSTDPTPMPSYTDASWAFQAPPLTTDEQRSSLFPLSHLSRGTFSRGLGNVPKEDVIHLADEKPAGHRLLGNPHTRATPRLYEEIQQLRHMADLLERSFYPLDIPPDTTPPTLENTPPLALVDTTTTKPSYSAAAKSAIPPPAAAKVAEWSAGKTQTKKPPQKPRLPNAGPQLPTPSRSAAQRLILRFPNSSVIKSVSDPQRLRDTLSDVLQGTSKHLVIHHVPVIAVGNRPLVEELRWSNEAPRRDAEGDSTGGHTDVAYPTFPASNVYIPLPPKHICLPTPIGGFRIKNLDPTCVKTWPQLDTNLVATWAKLGPKLGPCFSTSEVEAMLIREAPNMCEKRSWRWSWGIKLGPNRALVHDLTSNSDFGSQLGPQLHEVEARVGMQVEAPNFNSETP
ncbi:hypothetical protein K438DRAFT_2084809 [Mycena galopus ATCC 62051]|nr:hypothetical protein K438DRAFT_2084809 [Mycena galopus ATCC 62051]